MQPHKVVSREQWIEARKAHLAHEKEFTQARDRLAQERRALPWVKVDKDYAFDGPAGNVALARPSLDRLLPTHPAKTADNFPSALDGRADGNIFSTYQDCAE